METMGARWPTNSGKWKAMTGTSVDYRFVEKDMLNDAWKRIGLANINLTLYSPSSC